MQRGDVGFVAGLAGFLLGGFAAFSAASMKSDLESVMNEREADQDALTGVGARVEDLERSHKELTRRVGGLSSDPKTAWEAIHDLQGRMQKLERGGAAAPANGPGEVLSTAAPKGMTQDDFAALRQKVNSEQASEEEDTAYRQALREHPELMDALLRDLEKKVADTPRDIAKRLDLARGYIEKLYTVSDMEKGALSMKAVAQWNAILEIDPNHWESHQSLGFNYSFWPEQFNKGPDAIKHFEAARKIQEASTPEPKHANTYIQLQKLYVKAGKAAEAKEVLEEGLRRFPDDEELKKLR
jgi:TolA-binding protein